MAELIRAMTSDGSARVIAIDGRDIVERARQLHNTSPTATAALGRSLMAASMMGSLMTDERSSLTLRFAGDGEGGKILCTGDWLGNVRGLIENPAADPPLRADGKLDVAKIVGKGTMQVLRDVPGGEPYTGVSDIVSGEIAEDIASYFALSEQVPTLCALGVLVDTDLSVRCAGGILVQMLPFADDGVAERLEHNALECPSITTMMLEGGIKYVMSRFLEEIEYDVFDTSNVDYRCDCSRDRCEKALASLGTEDFRSLYSDEKIQMHCSFCNTVYTFTHDDLDRIDAERRKK